MSITSTTLREIAAMPAEAMAVALLFLAGQLEQQERKRALAAERQARYRDAHPTVIPALQSRNSNGDVTALARVEDNTLPSFTSGEGKKVRPPCKPPRSSKPLPSEPEGFAEFMAVYPKRDGSQPRSEALKAWGPALKRADFATIMEGVHHFAAAMALRDKIGTEFIPQARTWLNQNRWSDQYGSNPQTNSSRSRPQRNSIHDSIAVVRAALVQRIADERGEGAGGTGPGNQDAENLSRFRQDYSTHHGRSERKAG